MLLAELGIWGWIVFGVVAAVGIVVVAVVLMRRPAHPTERDAPDAAALRAAVQDDAHRVVVVVCDESCTSPAFVQELVGHAAGRRLAVFVAAPELGSRLSRWTDDDSARGDAGEHLAATLEALRAAGIDARGEIGAHDPLRAADDALREFPADEVVFATHAEDQANWLEQGVVEAARTRYDVPVTHVVVPGG
jgi:GABA permease